MNQHSSGHSNVISRSSCDVCNLFLSSLRGIEGHEVSKVETHGHLIAVCVDTAADILVPRTGRVLFLYQPPQTLTYTYKQSVAFLMAKSSTAPTVLVY